MEKYDYREAMKNDIMEYLKENKEDLNGRFYDRDELSEYLNDELFIEDSVTGNASGSYFFNAYKAEEAICHNLGLYLYACQCFGQDAIITDAETIDVTIRCYLLGQMIEEALDEFQPVGFYGEDIESIPA